MKKITKPELDNNLVLVQVKAISINPWDVSKRNAEAFCKILQDKSQLVLGWDISGTVVESRSEIFKIGDQVFGMVNFLGNKNAYSKFVAAPATHLAKKPSHVSHEQAAATTLSALAAYQAVVSRAGIKTGQKVLIHGASGGVGHFAVQIAKHIGAIVTGTSSSCDKDFILGLGADNHLDSREFTWKTKKDNYDFVLETIGDDNLEKAILVVVPWGKSIYSDSSSTDEIIKRVKARLVDEYFMTVESNESDMKKLADLLDLGIIKAYITKTYGFDDLLEAHYQVASGTAVGKIVVKF